MSDWYIEDEQFVPVLTTDMRAAGEYLSNPRRIVAKTLIEIAPDGTKCELSTVFLGLDHNYRMGPGPYVPILYESLVFGGPCDGEMQRYPTRGLAQLGHDRMVSDVRTKAAGKRAAELVREAAPDLLAACEAAEARLAETQPGAPVLLTIHAAIKKARGT